MNTVASLPAKWREIAARIRDDMPPESHHEYGECCGNITRLEICARELDDALADIAGLVKILCMKDEAGVMLALANRIVGNAHPAEDARLEVAYEIARYLKLDWPAALASPAPSAGVVDRLAAMQMAADKALAAVSEPCPPMPTAADLAMRVQEKDHLQVLRKLHADMAEWRNGDKATNLDGWDRQLAALNFAIAALQHFAAPSVSPSVEGDAGGLPEYVTYEDASEAVKRAYRYGTTGDGFSGPLTWLHDRIRRLATAEQPIEWGGATRTMQEHLYVMTGERDRCRMLAKQQAEQVARLEQRIAEQPGSAGEVEAVDGWVWWREPPPGKRFMSHIDVRFDGVNTTGWERVVLPRITTPPPAPAASIIEIEKLPRFGFYNSEFVRLDDLRELVSAAPAAEQGAKDWFCATCSNTVDPSAVTFDERHDSRVGGCGMPVTYGIPAPQPEARGVEGMVLVPRELLADVEEQLVDLFNEKSANRGIYREREKLHDADVLQKVRLLLASTPNPVRAEQPEGKWKLVPVEPTHAMELALSNALASGDYSIGKCLEIALAAAPAAPGAAVGVDEAMARRLDDYLGGEFDIRIGKQAAHAALIAALAGKAQEESNGR